MTKKDKARKTRKIFRARKKIFGTPERPRLSVFRSLNHIYAQIIDDVAGKTLVAASSKSVELADDIKNAKGKVSKSKLVGTLIAKKAVEANIKSVVFDRGLSQYHGRVKAVAEAAREGGLEL
ncbi:MAG: 50S ribosomal protein L18 [Ignavibacteriae bacterium HGW-Ignavibacteriae-2]|jgi:large subunit ribosomal protein L18|nr:50S ribosomal protein L18 [Bacteroidota bacterium]PKL89058.1 MAG: 50S ribosomal protein L18 [Ignavibacteriae bacterium HGW-Ignavibacteriae-2]